MDALPTSFGWKDLLTLTTGISGLLFSLAAYRFAKAADKRAIRAEGQALVDAIVSERERALGEIHAMKAAWASRRTMMRMYDPSDAKFDQLVDKQMRTLDFWESSVQALAPQIAAHEDLVKFRTGWVTRLQEMRAQDAVAQKAFEELVEILKAEHNRSRKTRSDI